MPIKISEFFSEYELKDKASKTLSKIEKEDKKLKKSLDKNNKSLNKNQKEFKQSSRELNKYSKETVKATRQTKNLNRELNKTTRGRGSRSVGRFSSSAGGGGFFAQIGQTLPFIGAAIVAAAASIEKAASAFNEAARAQGERARFRRAGAVDPSLRRAQQTLTRREGGAQVFAANDVERALSRLSELGITNISKEQLTVIETEARRVGTVTQAIENIITGQGFRSLGQAGKNVESIAKNLQFTAQSSLTDFNVIINQIKQLQQNQSQSIQKQTNETEDFRRAQKRQLQLQRADEQRSIELAASTNLKTINIVRDAQNDLVKITADTSSQVIKSVNEIVKKIQGFFQTSSAKESEPGNNKAIDNISKLLEIGKKLGFFAKGGNISPNQFAVVGEKGPEILRPRQGGNVIPNDKISRIVNNRQNNVKRNNSVNFGNINININTNSNNANEIAEVLENKLPNILNSYANTILSRQLGLSEGLT